MLLYVGNESWECIYNNHTRLTFGAFKHHMLQARTVYILKLPSPVKQRYLEHGDQLIVLSYLLS